LRPKVLGSLDCFFRYGMVSLTSVCYLRAGLPRCAEEGDWLQVSPGTGGSWQSAAVASTGQSRGAQPGRWVFSHIGFAVHVRSVHPHASVMKPAQIEIPEFQNWSCHGCTDCCRGGLLIMLTPADKQRIEQQNWTPADGVDPAATIVAEGTGFRLGHQSDGACVFLDPSGRCRIHAKFGEEAKPLACRLYPLVIHPAGKKLVVGLRFSCPSAAANRGQALSAQRAAIQGLANLVVPSGYQEGSPPPVAAAQGEWPDLLRFVKWLDRSLAAKDVPVALKLLRTLHWLRTVEKGYLDQITGSGADEILEVLVQSAAMKVPALPESPPPPSRFGQLFFRLLVLDHARAVTVKELGAPGRHRWAMLWASLRIVRASGRTPALGRGLTSVPFSAIEGSFGPLSPGTEAMLTRFFRVKIQSLHFCGRAFHDRPLIEGFRALALLYPAMLWLGRWLALSDQRTAMSDADVARAVSMVDARHDHAPYLRWRIQLLSQRDDIARLCAWYGR
jgi:lysine-N-methylase